MRTLCLNMFFDVFTCSVPQRTEDRYSKLGLYTYPGSCTGVSSQDFPSNYMFKKYFYCFFRASSSPTRFFKFNENSRLFLSCVFNVLMFLLRNLIMLSSLLSKNFEILSSNFSRIPSFLNCFFHC